MRRWSRWELVGREIHDATGAHLGPVVDTWPWDGGGEPELAVVRLPGPCGGRRLLPVADLWDAGPVLCTPFARRQVEDAPELSLGRHAVEDPDRARSYWLFEEPAAALELV